VGTHQDGELRLEEQQAEVYLLNGGEERGEEGVGDGRDGVTVRQRKMAVRMYRMQM
jgi:hypothetical protein